MARKKTISHNSQKGLFHIGFGMDADAVIRQNLARIMKRMDLNQRQFAMHNEIDPVLFNQIMRGVKGLGKDLMARICTKSKLRIYEFYLEPDTPIVEDEEAMRVVQVMRQYPEIKDQIVVVSEALADQYKGDKEGRREGHTLPAGEKKKRRKTA